MSTMLQNPHLNFHNDSTGKYDVKASLTAFGEILDKHITATDRLEKYISVESVSKAEAFESYVKAIICLLYTSDAADE